MAPTPQTPGVSIQEIDAFPNSIVAVPTSVPAFIGYTPRADDRGKSYLHQPVEINSYEDYLTFFGALTDDQPPAVAPDSQQYTPIYHVTPSKGPGEIVLDGKPYDLLPDSGTLYYLYNSIKLFYENGGERCFVISVGHPGSPAGHTLPSAAPLVNPNVRYADLAAGLKIAAQTPDVTILVIPEAVLLKEADYARLISEMLAQCAELGNRVALLDVYGGQAPDPQDYLNKQIANFRTAVGTDHLSYGAAYFPFLKTSIVENAAINFLNLGGAKELAAVLPTAGMDPLKTILSQMQNLPAHQPAKAQQLDQALLTASTDYKLLHARVLDQINLVPPSATMAGVYAETDNNLGVWKAPANVGLVSVHDTTLAITDTAQSALNVDALTGKSINVIRLFPGLGVLVWGARTLDGNSLDWRYVSVRRTVIMIEQSVKLGLQAYAFSQNTETTWAMVRRSIANFLRTLWEQGGLAGATPADAFQVAAGLGTTMTPADIQNGNLIVEIRVAVVHPAEFVVISISQLLAAS